MEWIFLSLLGAFGQALGWAIKKRSLENLGVNNTLGFVSYATAGIVLYAMLMVSGDMPSTLSAKFWWATGGIIVLNVIALWTAYRALDKEALSTLMPYIALTAVLIVPIEFGLRGILPAVPQIIGVCVVVVGAIVFSRTQTLKPGWVRTAKYFGITLLCYSITSPLMGVAVNESGSGIFSAFVMHAGISVGFIPLLLMTREDAALKQLQTNGRIRSVILLMVASGLVTALLENGPITIALETGSASEVFALKRVMPFFALVLGVIMFKERIGRRHIVGTVLLVIGSFLIVWFR